MSQETNIRKLKAMRKICVTSRILFFIILVTITKMKSQVLIEFKKDTVIGWQYHWGDEFNKNEIDKDKWITHLEWSKLIAPERIIYNEENISMNNGVAMFKIDTGKFKYTPQNWELDTNEFKRGNLFLDKNGQLTLDYSGGLLWSKENFEYGYFEAKIKSTKSKGMWPAFWLYGKETDEIDFIELKGEKNDKIHIDVHCKNGCADYYSTFISKRGFGKWIKTKNKNDADYFIISGTWDNSKIVFMYNGVEIGRFNGTVDGLMNLIIGNGKAHKGGPFAPGVDKTTTYPANFYCDYLRVYKQSPNASIQSTSNRFNNSVTSISLQNTFNPTKSKKIKNGGCFVTIDKLNMNEIYIRALGKISSESDLTIEFYNTRGGVLDSKKIENSSEAIINAPEGTQKIKLIYNTQIHSLNWN